MKVTLHFKNGRIATYDGIGTVCTNQHWAIAHLSEASLARSVLAYDDAVVDAVIIEEEETKDGP